jgi:hypothetical protein
MVEQPRLDMLDLFSDVLQALKDQRSRLNQADTVNGNHGDHMIAIFDAAVCTAQAVHDAGFQASDISEVMLQASHQLRKLEENDSARVYGMGLALLAERLRERNLTLNDLVSYTASQLRSQGQHTDTNASASSRELDVVKALLDALADWERYEARPEKPVSEEQSQTGTDLGYLFGAGMAYLQAKQKGGERLDILVETAVNASPLGRVPHRAESGRLVIRTLLQSMAGCLANSSG